MKRTTLIVCGLMLGMVILMCVAPAMAFEWEGQVQNFFEGSTGFLVKTVGSGVFVIGLVVAGIKIAGGDQSGLRKAVLVMIGGAVIFLAKPIVEILSSLAAKSSGQ